MIRRIQAGAWQRWRPSGGKTGSGMWDVFEMLQAPEKVTLLISCGTVDLWAFALSSQENIRNIALGLHRAQSTWGEGFLWPEAGWKTLGFSVFSDFGQGHPWDKKKRERESDRENEVTQSCSTLCNLVDCSPQGSSVHGVFQARVLEWGAISYSRGSSWPRDRTQVSWIAGRCFTLWAPGKPSLPELSIILMKC